ncbi:DUF2225 domain-containing protein [Candidatus Neptunochlamydia vexilliferae]|uniref:DUF2225 domain-containing protein n=1 Tax=Candidatus Neptunichlamydia vexilliferae TaxID=1651774 RepID=UPI0018918643|nr:DUF2225 domain-containing protein [Candidatus Neptunochlamydia vexilliferae]
MNSLSALPIAEMNHGFPLPVSNTTRHAKTQSSKWVYSIKPINHTQRNRSSSSSPFFRQQAVAISKLPSNWPIPLVTQKLFSESSSSKQDIDGSYYSAFESAYDSKNLKEQIIYLEKMGKRAQEKGDFIRAAHLLNSALAITPLSQTSYQKYLFDKLEALEQAFLVKKLGLKSLVSQKGYLACYRKNIANIRSRTAAELSKKGADIEKVQKEMTIAYQNLLSKIIQQSIECIQLPPPCAFAVMGLGSMARKEMCPYSDIEFAFIVAKEEEKCLDYFRNLTHFLELRFTNFGETKWPILRPKRQPDGSMREAISLTPGGFSMDIGGLSPLGKKGVYELIGNPKHLAAYQDPAWLQKNDGEIILVNAMTQGSYVMGNKGLFEDYQKLVAEWLYLPKGNKELEGEKRALNLLRGHLSEFRPYLNKERIHLRAFDIKRDFYRPFQMAIGSLSLYHKLPREGSLQSLQALKDREIINNNAFSTLSKGLKIALTLRVRAHLFYQKEKEILYRSKAYKDIESKGLFTISHEESLEILELYRILFPMHTALEAFLKSPKESLQAFNFYDKTIGTLNHNAKDNLDYSKAESSYVQATALNPNDSKALLHLGQIQHTLGKVDEALNITLERLKLLKQKHGNIDHSEVAVALNEVGRAYYNIGKNSQAITYYKKSLEMHRKIYETKPHSDISTSLNNLGLVYHTLADYKKAIDCYTQALEISRKVHENNPHQGIAIELLNLGLTYNALGTYKKAIDYYTEALEIFYKVYEDKPHPKIATTLNNLGLSYCKLEEYQKAIDYYTKSLDMNREVYGGNPHPQIITKLNNLGEAYNKLKNHQKAIECYTQALKMSQKVYKNHPHSDVATVLSNLGFGYSKLMQSKRAIDYYTQALEMRRKIFDPSHPSIAISLLNLGTNYYVFGKPREGHVLIAEAHEIFNKVYGPSHPKTKTAKESLSQIKQFLTSSSNSSSSSGSRSKLDSAQIKRAKATLKSGKRALRVLKFISSGESKLKLANIYIQMGDTYKALGEYRKSHKMYKQAFKIKKSFYKSPSHKEVLEIVSRMEDIKKN